MMQSNASTMGTVDEETAMMQNKRHMRDSNGVVLAENQELLLWIQCSEGAENLHAPTQGRNGKQSTVLCFY